MAMTAAPTGATAILLMFTITPSYRYAVTLAIHGTGGNSSNVVSTVRAAVLIPTGQASAIHISLSTARAVALDAQHE